jgi:hemerythrin-like metal-binding protein
MNDPRQEIAGGGDMIAPLRLSDTFAVGHKDLDAEHRLMVELINSVCVAHGAEREPKGLSVLLRRLEDVTEQHFRHEEIVLQGIRTEQDKRRPWLAHVLDAAINDHSVEHTRMLDDLRAITNKMLTPRPQSTWAAYCEELKAWFVDHAIEYESQIKTVLQSV